MTNDYIIIQQITLRNWAQYEDETISFPTEEKSEDIPVTFIIGDNGAGKTRLFQGIRIALFGSDDPSIINKNNLIHFIPQKIKNEIQLKKERGEQYDDTVTIDLTISLKVSENNVIKYYKIQRSWTYTDFDIIDDEIKGDLIFDGNNASVETKNTLIDRWKKYQGQNIDLKLNRWFPEESREFYFFDGEKLEDMMSGKNQLKKSKIVNKILQRTECPILDAMIDSLIKQDEQFERYSLQVDRKVNNVQRAHSRLQNLKKNLEDKKLNIKKLGLDLEKQRGEEIQINQEIDSIGIHVRDIRRRESDRETISKHEELTEKKNGIHNYTGASFIENGNFEWILIENIMEEVRRDLISKMEQGIVPTKLDQQIYDLVLKKSECIVCGTKLDSNEQKKEIERRREESVDAELNSEAQRFLQKLNEISARLPNVKKVMLDRKKIFMDVQRELDILGDKPESTGGEQLHQYIKLTRRRDKSKEFIREIGNQIEQESNEIPKLENDIIDAEKDYKRNLKAEGKVVDSHLYWNLTSEIIKIIRTIREELETNIITYIKRQAESNFLKLIPNPEIYNGIYIGEDWTFGYYLKETPSIPIKNITGPSKGQFHVLGISFLHSIAQIANVSLPIIFDTPFGRISEEPKEKIGRNLKRLFRGTQLSFFVTDSEARKLVEFVSNKEGYLIENPRRIKAEIRKLTPEEVKSIISA